MKEVIELDGVKYRKVEEVCSKHNIEELRSKKRQWVIDYKDFDPEDEQQCLEAVKENGWVIQYINNPSEAVQLEAVKENGYTIVYINNPSEAVIEAALDQNPDAYIYI